MAKKEKTSEPKRRILKSSYNVGKEPSQNDSGDNPLIKINDRDDFSIELGNFLDNPMSLINSEFEPFDPNDTSSLDQSRIKPESKMLIILRYYEYIIQARFNVSFILPVWSEGTKTGDISFLEIIQSIEHHLQMKLQMKVPTFDEINFFDIKYLYKIKY